MPAMRKSPSGGDGRFAPRMDAEKLADRGGIEGTQAFLRLLGFEGHFLSFLEVLSGGRPGDVADVEKNVVPAAVGFDKAKSTVGVKKLDLSSFHSELRCVVGAPPLSPRKMRVPVPRRVGVTQVTITADTKFPRCGSSVPGPATGFSRSCRPGRGTFVQAPEGSRNFGGQSRYYERSGVPPPFIGSATDASPGWTRTDCVSWPA